ncbi:MAG: DUF11 domain-containing protein [Chloroflexi bacterium]|nr:DUF11 domain-containing protein [Chloroflexota bacterium]
MNKRITFIISSISLATMLLLAIVALMAGFNAAPVQAAPAEIPPSAPLQQTTTTPTYVISDSVTGGIPYVWDEISDSGQGYYLGGDNWGSTEIDIGFYFPFYDNVYRTFRASTNGYIYFDGLPANGGPIPLFVGSSSAPNNFIAPFGANLYMHPGVSRLYVEQQPTRTIIEFVDAQWCCGLNDPHTFQIILYRDGRILIQYRQIRYAANPNERVVAGIENDDGSDGIAYYQNWFQEDTSLNDGLAVLYDPGDSIFGHLILDAPVDPWWDDPGQRGVFDVTLFNLTGITDTFDVTYTVHVSSTAVPNASQWLVFVPDTAAVTGTGSVIFPYPIPNLGESTFQLTATIPVTAAWWDLATLHITASATSSPSLYSTIALTYGVAQRDLRIEKSLAPNTPPAPGGYFRYRVTITNDDYPGSDRSAWARSVLVSDTLPFSATLLALDQSVGSTTSPTGTMVPPYFFWNLGDIPPNGTESIDVYMQVPESVPTGTLLLNTAWTSMSNSIERGPFDNNLITHTLIITERRLILDVDKGLLYPGVPVGPDQILTYTLWVENQGNVPISDVVVSDVIPLGTTFISTTWPTSTLLPDDRTVVFTISRLLNGGWNGVGFQVGISIPATTTIGTWLTNTAQVTTTASLMGFVQATGDSDDLVIQLTDPRGDVAVVKYPEMIGGVPVTPEPGGDYTFWISYTNLGYVPVYTVTLTDTLPISYVVLLEAGPAGTAQPDTSTPGQVVWDIPVLPATGAIGWTRVRIQIDDFIPDGVQLVNTVEIAAAAGDNITTTNDSSTVTVILDAPDVTISKWVTPTGTMSVSDTITYTIRFANTGDIAADGVRITDVLPSQLTNVTYITSGHPIEPVGGTTPLVWRAIQPLDPGDSGFITITGLLDPAATWPPQSILTNRAEIHTTTGEQPINDPNTAQVTNTVAMPSPYVAKTGPTLALPGTLVSYTIEYGNDGLLDAHNVRLTDTLPVSTTYVTHTASFTATPASGWITWEVGTIPGQTPGTTFTLVVSVSPGVPAGTPLENTVELASSTYDGDRTDNESVWITAVGFDLSGSHKQVNGTNGVSVGSGEPVTYAIVLVNNGPFAATPVSVWDPIPADTAYVSNSVSSTDGVPGYDAGGDAITWTGSVGGYSMVTVTFQVTVANAGPLPRDTIIANTAFISDGIQDFQTSVPLTITGPNLDGSYKTVNNPQPATGENITYTIVLENSGEADAIGASFSDNLPAPYVNYSGGGSASSGTLGSGNPVTWTGTVVQGGRVTVTLPVQVTAGPGNHFDNTVQINDGTGEMIQRSVTVSTTRPIMQVDKTVSSDSVTQGDQITYTIAIENVGDGWALPALMTDTIQGGNYITSQVVGGSGTLDDSNLPDVTWTGPLAPGAGTVITIVVEITATPGSNVPNIVEVNDGYGTVDTDSTLIHVYSSPDISNSTKRVNQVGARTGDTLVYTLTVVNSGELSTTFSVNDTLDPNTIFTAFVGSPPGSYGHAAGVVTWTGTVNGDDQVQLEFEAVVNAVMSGGVTNTARFEGDGGTYTDTAVTQILVPAELTATKQVEPVGPVIAGEFLTYTIVMRNVGGDDAHVTFSDEIPAHTDYDSQSAQIDPPPPAHAPPDASGSPITWNGNLAASEAATLTFQVQVAPGTVAGTVISNVAWLQETNEPGPFFGVAVSNTVLAPIFTATKQANPAGVVLPGNRITYTLVVTNESTGIAQVTVTDTLPISATCLPATIEVFPGTHDLPVCAAGTLTWQGNVNSYSFARLTYAVVVSDSVPTGAIIANSAQVQELSQPADILIVGTSNVVVAPDLSADKRVSPEGDIFAGGELTYTIVISNSGNADALVSFSDPLPANTDIITTYVTPITYNPPVYAPTTLTWNDVIAPNESATITLRVAVNAGTLTGTVISNVGWFQELNEPGPVFSDSVSNTVRSPVLNTDKQSTPSGPVRPNDTISYSIVIANADGGIAQAVMTDTIPAHTTYVSFSVQASEGSPPIYDPGSERITWQGNIDVHHLVTVTFAVTVDPDTADGEIITNIAQVEEMSQPGMIASPSVTNPVAAPNVSMIKQVDPPGNVIVGTTLSYTIVITNDGGATAQIVFSDTVPTYTTFITGSEYVIPSIYAPLVHSNGILTWQEQIGPGQVATITFRVQIDPGTPSGTTIYNVAQMRELSDPTTIYSDTTTNTALAPTFSAAKYATPQNFVRPGDTINYDIVLNNTTLGIAWAVMTDTVPTNTTYISESARIAVSVILLNAYDPPPEKDPIPDPPIYDPAENRLTWEGNIVAYTTITLSFDVAVNPDVEDGTMITNTAWVDEISNPIGPMSYSVTNTVFSEFGIYLPIVLKRP